MKRAKNGDVFRIVTPRGDAYLQLTLKNPIYGSLVRVLPGLFPEGAPDVSKLANELESYRVFFPVQAAFNQKLLSFDSNHPVPSWAQGLPTMRRPGAIGPDGRILSWMIWNGSEEWTVTKLSKKEAQLSPAEIWNDTLLIERLCAGWTPMHDLSISA